MNEYTQLSAVNAILSVEGLPPVTTLNSTLPQVQTATARLDEADIFVQKVGWWFNTDYDVAESGGGSGNINLPDATLRIESREGEYAVVRKDALNGDAVRAYAPMRQSFDWTDIDIVIDITERLDFEDLPAVAQDAIVLRAQYQVALHELEDYQKAEFYKAEVDSAMAALAREHQMNRRLAARDATAYVLQEGWWFNTDYDVELEGTLVATVGPPAREFYEYDVGARWMRVIGPGYRNITIRGGKLYDMDRQTSEFPDDATLCVSIIKSLNWDNLPPAAQDAIRARAIIEDSVDLPQQSGTVVQANRDFQRAWTELKKQDIKSNKRTAWSPQAQLTRMGARPYRRRVGTQNPYIPGG